MSLDLESFWNHLHGSLAARAKESVQWTACRRTKDGCAGPFDLWNQVICRSLADCKELIGDQLGRPVESHSRLHGKEWICDFSMTRYSRPQVLSYRRCTEPWPKDAKYEILLAAEAEMNPHPQQILYDFLKLGEIKSCLKIIFYRAKGVRGHQQMRRVFERTLSRLQRFDSQEKWLFVGIERWHPNSRDAIRPVAHPSNYYASIVLADSYRLQSPPSWPGTLEF